MAKENIKQMERESTVWERIFANDTSDKGLISKIYRSHMIPCQEETIQLKNGQST